MKLVGLFWAMLFAANTLFASIIPFEDFAKAVRSEQVKVIEFKWIVQKAKELDIDGVYLFGGSASSWAHFVYDSHVYSKNILDQDDITLADVFRTNQDFDLVLDTDEAKAEQFEALINEQFPYSFGKKSFWEIRLLRRDYKKNEGLINSREILDQHSDGHSLGIIPLKEKRKTSIELSPFDMNGRNHFLELVYNHQLEFHYHPETHFQTMRFKQGTNPEIISVIRALIKANQFDLYIDQPTLTLFKRIIHTTPFEDLYKNNYVRNFFELSAPKLFQNAQDIEKSWNLLEELGLRKKLIAMSSLQQIDSLAHWMNREPLRSYELSQIGTKASERFKSTAPIMLAHETSSFDNYDNILKSNSEFPSLFISRTKSIGEEAKHGEGLYTKLGTIGGRGTGLAIYLELNPEAREGVDFEVIDGDIILIKNRKAIKISQYNFNSLSFDEYLDLVKAEALSSFFNEGQKAKLRHRFSRQIKTSPNQFYEMIKAQLAVTSNSEEIFKVLCEIFSIDEIHKLQVDPNLFFENFNESFFIQYPKNVQNKIIQEINQRLTHNENLADKIATQMGSDLSTQLRLTPLLKIWLAMPISVNYQHLLDLNQLSNDIKNEFLEYLFQFDHWRLSKFGKNEIDKMLKTEVGLSLKVRTALNSAIWAEDKSGPGFIANYLKKLKRMPEFIQHQYISQFIYEQLVTSKWALNENSHKIILTILEMPVAQRIIATAILTRILWINHPHAEEMMLKLLEKLENSSDRDLKNFVYNKLLASEYWNQKDKIKKYLEHYKEKMACKEAINLFLDS